MFVATTRLRTLYLPFPGLSGTVTSLDYVPRIPPLLNCHPLGGARVFICASESCFGCHAFVSRSISSNQSFTDSQNYDLSGDIRFFAEKLEQVGAVTRKYDAARQKGGDNFKKSDFKLLFSSVNVTISLSPLVKVTISLSPLVKVTISLSLSRLVKRCRISGGRCRN
eukprot:sb/3472429/